MRNVIATYYGHVWKLDIIVSPVGNQNLQVCVDGMERADEDGNMITSSVDIGIANKHSMVRDVAKLLLDLDWTEKVHAGCYSWDAVSTDEGVTAIKLWSVCWTCCEEDESKALPNFLLTLNDNQLLRISELFPNPMDTLLLTAASKTNSHKFVDDDFQTRQRVEQFVERCVLDEEQQRLEERRKEQRETRSEKIELEKIDSDLNQLEDLLDKTSEQVSAKHLGRLAERTEQPNLDLSISLLRIWRRERDKIKRPERLGLSAYSGSEWFLAWILKERERELLKELFESDNLEDKETLSVIRSIADWAEQDLKTFRAVPPAGQLGAMRRRTLASLKKFFPKD
jgi:hypothetical protein